MNTKTKIIRVGKKLILFLLLATYALPSYAISPDEGMWLPLYLKQKNEKEMKRLGMQLGADDIYDTIKPSLKDAIVSLGGFCTAELVSENGLLFTNHHCGYDAIASHSSKENNYLDNGFWAKSYQEELTNDRLTASILVKMVDYSSEILAKEKELEGDLEKEGKLSILIDSLTSAAEEGNHYKAFIKPFFNGNEYYLLVYEVFKDVRLVGAPPSSIGKFGGETDNWMWPRHTGDFSIFRIYTDSAGLPATYSKSNVPYHPKKFLKISLNGVHQGDFTMIYGFPGSTTRYLTSSDLQLRTDCNNPALIDAFTSQMKIMKEAMDADTGVRLTLASSYASLANTQKNTLGEQRMVGLVGVKEKMLQNELALTTWINESPDRIKKYGEVLNKIKYSNEKLRQIDPAFHYIVYSIFNNAASQYGFYYISVMRAIMKGSRNVDSIRKKCIAIIPSAQIYLEEKDKIELHKKMLAGALSLLYQKLPENQQIDLLKKVILEYPAASVETSFLMYLNDIYSKSSLTNKSKVAKFLKKANISKLNADPFYHLFQNLYEIYYKNYRAQYFQFSDSLDKYQKLYEAAIMDWKGSSKALYPDANSTLRLTYGSVLSYTPRDAVGYKYYTTTEGILEKYNPDDPEFNSPSYEVELLKKRKFGMYGEKDTLRVCFLTNNDITGGNSGSPVLNGNGELVGLAFDGNWESLINDFYYSPDLNRIICVDIRYVLWVIDTLSGAVNITKELTLSGK